MRRLIAIGLMGIVECHGSQQSDRQGGAAPPPESEAPVDRTPDGPLAAAPPPAPRPGPRPPVVRDTTRADTTKVRAPTDTTRPPAPPPQPPPDTIKARPDTSASAH